MVQPETYDKKIQIHSKCFTTGFVIYEEKFNSFLCEIGHAEMLNER